MLCGLTRIRSKIKLWNFVKHHSEWKCYHFCPLCKYWETCMISMKAEQQERELLKEWEAMKEELKKKNII